MSKYYLITIFVVLLSGSIFAQTTVESTGKTFGSESITFQDPPHFRMLSKDSLNGKPMYDYFFLVKAKLNGVYDINGGMYGETFNAGNIPVWGDDDQQRFWMDMHQSQVRFRGQSETEHGTYTAYMEGDFWGGNKHFRLRHMWFEYKFADIGDNWSFVGHLGQDWSFFGDKEIWPNVFEWDGPSSGVWRREPELRFWFENRDNLRLEFGVANPGPQLYFDNNIDSTLTEAEQGTPDFIGAINKKFDFGHLRVTGIYRNLEYRNEQGDQATAGYGGSVSGYISTNSATDNPIQFQFVGGTGIAAYLVSFDGMNYDAAPDGLGNMESIPTVGGWASYEYWFSKKWHANLVMGFSEFHAKEINSFTIIGPDYQANNTSVDVSVRYLLLNLMWNPIPSVVLGAEWNIGQRSNSYEGSIDTGTEVIDKIEESRVANRISFGAFFNF
jgi:hypothetical protein